MITNFINKLKLKKHHSEGSPASCLKVFIHSFVPIIMASNDFGYIPETKRDLITMQTTEMNVCNWFLFPEAK